MADGYSQIATDTELDLDRDGGAGIDLARLYRLWEENSWSATAIDLSADIQDWRERLSPEQRAAARWNYSLFLHGEEAVARTLAPFITAAYTQEQRLFLTTQIVDEGRHHVFFSRYMREVLGGGHDLSSTLDATRPDLTWGFRKVFGELDRLTGRLRRQPGNRSLYARCIALYHLVVEGTLAYPGQHFMRRYTEERGVLPGLGVGVGHIARDESRHMAFGMRVLSELVEESGIRRDVLRLLDRVLPWAVAVFVPPDFDESYTRSFGVDLLEVFVFALRSLEIKLARVGIAANEVSALLKLGPELSYHEQARRALALLRAGVVPSGGSVRMSDEALALVFDGVRRVAQARGGQQAPLTIQWEFPDAPPWCLRVWEGEAEVSQERAEQPSLVLRCRVDDWGRIAGQQLDPRWALATRRLRVSGEWSLALRLPALLGA